MRKSDLLALCLLFAPLASFSQEARDSEATVSGILSLVPREAQFPADCDTVVEADGFKIRVIKSDGNLKHIGLNLFSDQMKHDSDEEMLNYIEAALGAKARGLKVDGYEKVDIVEGNVADLKKIGPETPCSTRNIDGKELEVSWQADEVTLKVTVPVSYDIAKGGSRAEIENRLIEKFRSGSASMPKLQTIDPETLEAVGEELSVFQGATFQRKAINRNVYFLVDTVLNPVWDARYPAESMSNLFIHPADKYGEVEMTLRVVKHEPGQQDTIQTTVNRFLSVCAEDGCTPYWGLEKYEDGKLQCALFLYNWSQGYDHVLKIEMEPEAVISGTGGVKAKASLYVPVNNVKNLFEPAVKRGDSRHPTFTIESKS